MLKVGVMIDLRRREGAGGHVKSWEKFAAAATEIPEHLFLSLHFLGDREAEQSIAENVRYVFHKPVFSTERIPFLGDVADHTDLAGYNRRLPAYFDDYDIIHTTHPLFAFGKTALRYCRNGQKPLVSSIHTDVPKYTQVSVASLVKKYFGESLFTKLLLDKLQLDVRRADKMRRQLAMHWSQCKHVFVSQPEEYEQVSGVLPKGRLSFLRRGINKELFAARRRDGERLRHEYGIAPEKKVLLFVGRLDACKNIILFAETVKHLLDQGRAVHAVMIGEGPDAQSVKTILGEHITFAGHLPQQDLAWHYASSDIFLFPSETETYGNVVVEAKAAGLPPVISASGGAAQLVQHDGVDGFLVYGSDPKVWANKVDSLLADPERCRKMSAAASADIESRWPDWRQVLEEDLLPYWQKVKQQSQPSSHYPERELLAAD